MFGMILHLYCSISLSLPFTIRRCELRRDLGYSLIRGPKNRSASFTLTFRLDEMRVSLLLFDVMIRLVDVRILLILLLIFRSLSFFLSFLLLLTYFIQTMLLFVGEFRSSSLASRRVGIELNHHFTRHLHQKAPYN